MRYPAEMIEQKQCESKELLQLLTADDRLNWRTGVPEVQKSSWSWWSIQGTKTFWTIFTLYRKKIEANHIGNRW